MRKVEFTQSALNEMNGFKSGRANLVFKILDLIEDIQKSPFTGLGKPEALKGDFQGFWSRRINDEHRLVYRVNDDTIEIYKCSGHYND